MGKNSKKYRRVVRDLRRDAQRIKSSYREKYDNKIEHLRRKYTEDEDAKLSKVPKEMEGFESLSIFNKDNFDKIEVEEYDVVCVGEVTLSLEEKSVLKLHPKFSVMQNLVEGGLDFEQEIAYAKLRMELGKEIEERKEDATEMTEEEKEVTEELDAKSRQVFDPMDKVFDALCNRLGSRGGGRVKYLNINRFD